MLKRYVKSVSVSLFLILTLMQSVAARTSLGVGVAEELPPQTGPFAWFFGQINIWQQVFEQAMTKSLVAMNSNANAGLFLIAISFIYGILHAIGPGHGKAVISSYLIANDETLKRGIVLSFASSLLQALSAIIIVVAVFYFLPIRWTTAAYWLTTASFALVTFLGLWMLIKTTPRLFSRKLRNNISAKLTNKVFDHQVRSDSKATSPVFNGHETINKPALIYKDPKTKHEFRGGGMLCADCGTAHIADPTLLAGQLNLRKAISAVLSVGLRPCSGALLVMSFAAVNNHYLDGLVSVFAMSLGTFITVSVLALIAVKMKDIALKMMTGDSNRWTIKCIFEWVAGAVIFVVGLSLVISSLISLP